MKNKKIQYFASAAALVLGAVLLTTCTVGLGDSVDTKSPKVSITYPPVQSIIKNTFTLRGTASDDNELVGVMITVTNTETDEVFDSYQATVDRATNTWSFVANRRNEDGSFEFEDGKYQIVATAVDGANRKTVASTTYEIDNTAPVLVLNRPGTVGPVGGVKPEVYGSELKLTGSANDDHALDLVSMRVFRADGTPIGDPLTYANVSGVGMEILLAKHYASPADADQQALTDRYAAIYDHSTGGTQNFYCLVDISDYAREYDPPANVASADNTRGNVSQAFWLYDGIYSRVFDKSGFGLTMSDLTSVLSGRHASVATAGEVREYLEANQQNSTVWSKTAVTFSLNPENSPYYEVVGYNALATNEAITAQASNGTNLTVRVSAGRDQRPLLSDTIRVYLVPCNANGAPRSGEGDNIRLLASIAELAGNTAAIEERNDRLSKTGNDYVVSVDVGPLVNGNYYLVKVEGKDQAGNEITDLNGTFGFQVIASGNPPVLVVNSPSDLSYISANSVNFEGTVEAEGGFDSLTATVRIIRLSDGVAVRNGQTFTINPSDSSWAFTLDKLNDIKSEDGLCMATVTLKATDLKNTITEQTLRLYIDHQAPKATITKVTPYYGYVYDSDTGTGTYTVNGTVDVTLSMTDNDQIDTYSYTIGSSAPVSASGVSSPVASVSDLEINTRLYPDKSDLPIVVTLRDRAGNEATVDLSAVIHVDQDTDRPTIELTNPLSLAADEAGACENLITGPSITGNVADDDGVSTLQLTIYDTDDNQVADKLFTEEECGAAIWKNFSYTFPSDFKDGIYRLVLDAKDINPSPILSNTKKGWFSYDNANPTITINEDSAWSTGTTFSLTGTAEDSWGVDRIVVTQNGVALPDIDASGSKDFIWELRNLPRDPDSPGETKMADGEFTYTVHAMDLANKTSTPATVTVTIDRTPPAKNDITAPTAGSLGVNALSGSTYLFRGEAGEPAEGVGVAKVWYQIVQDASAPVVPEEDSPADYGYTELVTGGGWSFTRDFPTDIAEGLGYHLHVLAEDKAGNRTAAAASVEFDVDLSNPVVTEEIGTDTMQNRREIFELRGTATDSHGIASVTITQSLDGVTAIPISTNVPELTGSIWSLINLPRDVDTIGNLSTVNGTYEYKITTTDLVGKTHTITRRVRFDSVGPEIEFTAPAEGGWQTSGDVKVKGLATDLTAVGGVYYSTAEVAPTIPTDPDADEDWIGWTPAGGSPGSWEVPFTGLPQGDYSVWVAAMDTNGNTTAAIQRTFGVDTALPQLTGVSTPVANTNIGFDLTGTATDTNALHAATPVTITQRYKGGSAVTISGDISLTDMDPTDGDEFDWKLEDLPRNPVSPLTQIAFDGSADGEYEFTITATDIAGKTKEVTRSVYIDTQAPTLTIPTAVEDTLTGWKREVSLPVSGSVTETGSGMDRIEYSLNGGAAQALSLNIDAPSTTNWNWSGNIPLSNGTGQTLTITAYDKAGNGVTSATYTFSVDLDSPTIRLNTPTAPRRTNLASPVVSTYTVTDNGPSGTATVLVTSIGDGPSGTAIDAADQASSNTTGDDWELSLPATTLGSLGLASGSSYVVTTTATDAAGNTSTANFTIIVDTTNPSVTISSPEDGATINKLTKIRGTASDEQSLSKVELYLEKGPDVGTFPESPTATFDEGEQYNWSYDFDTETWDVADYTGPVVIRVVATDEAGNTTTVDYTYTIDQESDRPRIRSSNVTFDDSDPDKKYPSTLQMTKNVIGTIEDDDGPVTSVEIWQKTSTDPDPEVWEWVEQPMNGISYTYQSYGDDGLKILRFRIIDAAGTKFITDATTDVDTTPSPKFEWGEGSTGEYTYNERTYSVDTNMPKNMGTVYANRTGGDVFKDTVTLDSNSSFGGTSAKFRLWLGASDDNGIDSIKVTIPSADPEEPYAEQTLRSDTHVVEITDVTEVAGYTIFRSGEFDISEVPDGNRKISITVTDNSGLESNASYTILVDNTGPDIDYSYPKHEVDQVFGNLTITGLVSDGGSGLPANAVTYQIGYDYDPDNDELWKTASVSGATWSITDFATSNVGGVRIENYTRQEADVDPGTDTLTVPGHGYSDGDCVWIGADELPGGLDYGTPYYILYLSDDTFKLASTLGGTAINITGPEDASVGVSAHAQSAVGNIWYLPVMIRATDTAGNEYITPEWIYRIKVDPSGDKPTAFVTYPEKDTVSAEPNPIVGGTIRMSGYAEDNIDVSAVFMQIDKNGDGIFNSSDGDWYISEEGETPDINQFEGRRVNGGRNWTMNINATGEFNPEVISGEKIEVDVVYRIVDTGTAAVNWTALGASATPSVGETFTAVRDGSADDSTARVKPVQRLIMYRVRACDNNGLYGSWTLPHYFLIDEGVPIIGSLRFEKPGRQRFYEPDMWLSGDWTLTGYVADESDIQAISIGDTTSADASQVTGSLAGNSDWFNSDTFGGLKGYGMEIPITTTGYLSTRTSNSFTFSATDKSTPPMTASREIRINYDNTKPNISAPYGGAALIKNSNGWYELKSSVVEDQSGFDRVMVVFHRPDGMTDGGRVYNPLSANPYTEWGSTNFIESPEGLPLMKYTATTRPDATSLTLTGIDSDPYARKGYYLRIGGEYYCITDRTGDTITWEGDVDQGIVDFELVYAIAVDLLNTEVSDTDGDGIIESVTRRGGTYDWSCSINSTNLPDGQMNIRYVAFDKAGNFARHDDIATRVENNPPLLAQVALATDLDGNGTITDGSGDPATLNEWNLPYSLLVADAGQKTATVTASNFTAKDFMEVVIDIVGGNGNLEYRLDVGGTTVHDLEEFNLRTGDYVEGSESTNTITVLRDDLVTIGEGAQSFVFSIWDSTETYALGTSTDFMAELTVALTVDVVDEVDPVTVVSPFFWNKADENSLYENSRANGHIELEDDLPASIFNQATGLYDKDPKVSGRITVRGTAFDDQRLTKLWMYLGNGSDDANAFVFTDAGDIETAFDQNPADGTFTPVAVNGTYSLVAEFDPASGWEVADTTVEDDGWRFTVDSASAGAYFNQDGHMVAWTLEIDTAQLPRRAETDFHFRMIAEDKRTNAGGTSTPNASEIGEKRVDIVPYIRTIGSGLSKLKKNNPSVYNRTALGRYPVSEDETITVSGFNLGGDQSVSMASYSSGPFTYTVNGVTTLNNENRNTAEYNQLPNGDNNPHLTDDVILDVWQLNSTAVHSVDGRINEPVMKINPNNGIAGFAFANGVDSFSMANGTTNSYTHWQRNYADYGEVAFGFDVQGRSHGIVIGHDTEPNTGYTGRMNYITSRWGVPLTDARDNFRWNNKLRMESCGLPVGARLQDEAVNQRIIDTTRFQSTSLAVASSAARTDPTLYLAYYDSLQEQIRFRWGTNNMGTRDVGNNGFNQFHDVDSAAGRNSNANDAYGQHIIFEPDAQYYSLIAGAENNLSNPTGNTAGEYVAIDVITGANPTADIVTVVWYDGTDLWYTYRSGDKSVDANASSTGNAYWSAPLRIFEEAGLDCAISVDANGGVHIAAYDRVAGALRYAYLPSYNADQDEVQTCIVDDHNIVGNKISITTVLDGSNNAIPYISYYAPSALKPKLAYLVDLSGDKVPDGFNEKQEFTGAWEITMIPTGSTVIEDRINVDLWRDANNRATTSSTGTSSSDTTSGTVYGNGTNNPLAAYVINEGRLGYIETAQKK